MSSSGDQTKRRRVDNGDVSVTGEGEKYQQILQKNQNWEYSATVPSGLNDRDREFVNEMKSLTCAMRHGTLCDAEEIDINAPPYNAAHMPHWEELTEALEEYQFALKCLPRNETSKLTVGGELMPRVIAHLSFALESTLFKSLSLQENHFGREGITFALDYVQNNPILEEFHLYRNHFEYNDDVERLCHIIKDHPSIHTLEIEECFGAGNNVPRRINSHDMLRSVMNAGASKLKFIDLANNGISTEGSTFIADFLATNPIVEKLVLYDNPLNDDDAEAIANALKYNTNLEFLNIRNALISTSGGNALRKAEYDDTDLNSASGSNHTCHIYEESRYNIERNEERGGSKAVRQKKIYDLLSARNREGTNIEHFDDISFELLPDMLQSIQQYSNYHVSESRNTSLNHVIWPRRSIVHVSPLSIVSEILRRWDKSLSAFESLGYMRIKQSTCSDQNRKGN